MADDELADTVRAYEALCDAEMARAGYVPAGFAKLYIGHGREALVITSHAEIAKNQNDMTRQNLAAARCRNAIMTAENNG